MIFERIIRKICLRRNQGILVFGDCFKSISKKASINAKCFSFNKDWNQKHLISKRNHGKIEIQTHSSLTTGEKSMMISGGTLVLFSGGDLTIGNNVLLNNNCEIYCSNKIVIGNDTVISNNCVIRDSDIHKILGKSYSKPISVGNHVWVGTNCIILKGVSIGDGAVIAAGSVVTNDVPPNSLVAGNPAVVIRKNVSWER